MYLVRQLRFATPRENMHMVMVVLHHLIVLATMMGREPTLYRRYRCGALWVVPCCTRVGRAGCLELQGCASAAGVAATATCAALPTRAGC